MLTHRSRLIRALFHCSIRLFNVISYLDGTHFLDVGIGTGLALVKNLDLMSKKKLKVTGVDYDNDYVLRCRDLFVKNGLIKNGTGEVFHASIYDWSQGPYDAAYFSGTCSSFILLLSSISRATARF